MNEKPKVYLFDAKLLSSVNVEKFLKWAENHPFALISNEKMVTLLADIAIEILASAERVFTLGGNEGWQNGYCLYHNTETLSDPSSILEQFDWTQVSVEYYGCDEFLLEADESYGAYDDNRFRVNRIEYFDELPEEIRGE